MPSIKLSNTGKLPVIAQPWGWIPPSGNGQENGKSALPKKKRAFPRAVNPFTGQ